ncbi:MAG: hypothetical protein IJH55_03010 [Romboutsia sp.]|nr:hypothetical protein [Romboutsia sp.]
MITTNVPNFEINYLTQSQYDEALANDEINALALYCVKSETPYIVETGGENDIFYRKWSDGKAEFWCKVDNDSGMTTTVWTAPIYYADVTTWDDVWSGIFNAAPINVLCSNNNSQFISVNPTAWTKDGVNLRFLSVNAKSNSAYRFSLYALGTWK